MTKKRNGFRNANFLPECYIARPRPAFIKNRPTVSGPRWQTQRTLGYLSDNTFTRTCVPKSGNLSQYPAIAAGTTWTRGFSITGL